MEKQPPEHSIALRVRYCEIDGQGRVHNSQYLNYFERGRVEMLRHFGISYRDFEAAGMMLVVKSMHVDFHAPAEFDEELELVTSLTHCFGARIDHAYRIVRAKESPLAEKLGVSIVTGRTSIVCVDRGGKVRRLPPELQLFKEPTHERPASQ